MFRFHVFVLVILSLWSFSLRASLIDNGHYSTDQVSGLDWLDTTQTAGFSYYQISTGAGGWLTSGWRYARTNELSDLFSRYVGTPSEFSFVGESHYKALNLVRQIGVNISFNNNEGLQQFYGSNVPTQISIVGIYNDGTDNSRVGIAELSAVISGSPSLSSRWVVYDDFWQSDKYNPTFAYGSFLVRDSHKEVTSPAPFFLILTLFPLFFLTRRRFG